MKIVMYHYVRPAGTLLGGLPLPQLPYLGLEDFERQLDYFQHHGGVIGREEFLCWREEGTIPEGFLLTFDDGLVDHARWVGPVLRKRGMFGLFYACSQPPMEGKWLDVQRVQLALARMGGRAVWRRIRAWAGMDDEVGSPENDRYSHQFGERETRYAKNFLNWRLGPRERDWLLEDLLAEAFPQGLPDWREVYMDKAAIAELLDVGMLIGPHGHRHLVISQLNRAEQREEVGRSCEWIYHLSGTLAAGYCFAHGLPEVVGEVAVQEARRHGCRFLLGASPSAPPDSNGQGREPLFPRVNCNALPWGKTSWDGPAAASEVSL